MAPRKTTVFVFRALLLALWFALTATSRAAVTNIESLLQTLIQQNETLQSQLHQQQELIDSLRRDVAGIHQADEKRDAEMATAKTAAPELEEPSRPAGFNFGKVHLSGEGGAGLFETGSEGAFPNSEFRVDEAKLFVDAQVWGDVYAFAELNLASREEPDVLLHPRRVLSRRGRHFQVVGPRRAVEPACRPDGHSFWRGISQARCD